MSGGVGPNRGGRVTGWERQKDVGGRFARAQSATSLGNRSSVLSHTPPSARVGSQPIPIQQSRGVVSYFTPTDVAAQGQSQNKVSHPSINMDAFRPSPTFLEDLSHTRNCHSSFDETMSVSSLNEVSYVGQITPVSQQPRKIDVSPASGRLSRMSERSQTRARASEEIGVIDPFKFPNPSDLERAFCWNSFIKTDKESTSATSDPVHSPTPSTDESLVQAHSDLFFGEME